MSTPGISYPPISAQFWWDSTLEYVDPGESSYQRYFLLCIACLASFTHQYEQSQGYDWGETVALKPFSKTILSVVNYWRIVDFSKGIHEFLYSAKEKTERVFKAVGGIASLSLLAVELSNRKIITGLPLKPIQFFGGVLGGTAYLRTTFKEWCRLGRDAEKSSEVNEEARATLKTYQFAKDSFVLAINASVFMMKTISLTALIAGDSPHRHVQRIIDHQGSLLLGLFGVAMLADVISHFIRCYMDCFVEENKIGRGGEG